MSIDRRQLGTTIRRLRAATGLSQHQLAAQLRITRSSVANIEAGRQGVNLDSLADLAAALGTTVSAFLGDDIEARQPVSTALLAKVAEQQRHITRTLGELAELTHRLADQSKHMERLLTENGIAAPTDQEGAA